MNRALSLASVGLSALLTCGAARAQFGAWDNSVFGPPLDMNGTVGALTTWDPDGAGSLPAQVVAGGLFGTAGGVTVNSIARWDGSAWQPLGSGVSNIVSSLTTWDPDGSGPLAAQLIAAGEFITAGGVTVNNIARWDGSVWHPLGIGTSSIVRAVTTWDPDGAGPLAEQVVAGGGFGSAGGVSASRIARWDGAAWQPLGSGMNQDVYSLTTWDPDGAGPLSAQLIAGGRFITAGGVTVNHIARWNGAAWVSLGSGVSNPVYALTTWDPDGSGPLAVQLVAGGEFDTASGMTVNNIARWDGSAWQSIGSGVSSDVMALTTLDPDGAGPLASQLVAGGFFVTAGGMPASRIARWDPDAPGWQPFGSGLDGEALNIYATSLTSWDPDGAGPQSARLVVGGDFSSVDGVPTSRIAHWDPGAGWQAFGSGTNRTVWSMTTWDMDGAGPSPDQLVAGGDFTSAGGVAARRIAHWDPGTGWHALGSGMDRTVTCLTTWDPDGAGPLAAQLVAGGLFTTAGGVTVNNIARWDPAAPGWQPLGSGMSGGVYSLTTWDPDGAGPLSAQLIAGGLFLNAGGVPAARIARWNGAAWFALGSGMNGQVASMTTWDPDGAGPQSALLVAGGAFTMAGGLPATRVASWNGTAWQPMGGGINNAVFAVTTWDPDGSGPQTAQPVAGGWFTTASGASVNRVARWDGAAWQPLGSGVDDRVTSLTSWDPDGAGPLAAQLVAGGEFDTAGGVSVNNIARWDGSAWHPLGSGTNSIVNSLVTQDLDGAGPEPAQLVAGGALTQAGGMPAGYMAAWAVPPPSCPGDANGDNVINAADLSVLLSQFGMSVTPSSGADFNSDGQVDGADLSVLLASFGSSC